MDMLFGICPTPHPWWKDIRQLHDWIIAVERFGYNGVFMPDHYNLPSFMSNELLDAWITLAYFAGVTKDIKLGTDVTPVPRWVPSQLAKVIATVDILSNGRVIAGFGAGAVPDEFLNYSAGGWDDAPVRVEKFSEGLQIILKLWTEDKVNFEGKYYRLKDAVLLPKPVQKPHPPIWCGGLGPRILRMAAKYFDGWVFPRLVPGVNMPPEECESRIRAIRQYAKDYGRDLANFTFGVLGSIMDTAETVEAYGRAGCQYYIVELFRGPGLSNPFPADEYIAASGKFAEEIIPSFT